MPVALEPGPLVVLGVIVGSGEGVGIGVAACPRVQARTINIIGSTSSGVGFRLNLEYGRMICLRSRFEEGRDSPHYETLTQEPAERQGTFRPKTGSGRDKQKGRDIAVSFLAPFRPFPVGERLRVRGFLPQPSSA